MDVKILRHNYLISTRHWAHHLKVFKVRPKAILKIYEFLTGNPHFPKDRDVAGGHTGCQVNISPIKTVHFSVFCHEHLFFFYSSVVAAID